MFFKKWRLSFFKKALDLMRKDEDFLTNVLIFLRLFLLLHFLIFNSRQNKGTY